MNSPRLIQGNLRIDDRGEVSFVNDFVFEGVKRMYIVRNHQSGFIRAWHAHKKEAKYIFVASGTALVGAVEIDNFENPSKNCKSYRFTLSAKTPAVLFVPPGYANGALSLTSDTVIEYFSTASIEEAKDDDYRYDARYWDIWGIIER